MKAPRPIRRASAPAQHCGYRHRGPPSVQQSDPPPLRTLGTISQARASDEGTTNRADLVQTHQADFDRVPFGMGVSTVGGRQARMVVAEDADGSWKAMNKLQYEVKPLTEDQT
jgi:hypothetical protein